MSTDAILIRGAREHNLRGIDLTLPRNRLIVITGLSGSGKSSLAFDTIYAEGQRRYVESLSAYARQFLEQLQKPQVELIEGLSPAIAIEQRTAGGNPRSTVGTTTEISDYLRLLFARIGHPHCPRCRRPIARQSAQEIVARILMLPVGTPIQIFAPLLRGRKGEGITALDQARREGFVRVRVDGVIRDLGTPIRLEKQRRHTVEAVVDRVTVRADQQQRITDSVEVALKVGQGTLIVSHGDPAGGGASQVQETLFSELLACAACSVSLDRVEPRLFSFNSPYGACPTCHGLGTRIEIDPELVVRDPGLTIREGAIEPWRRGGKASVLYCRRLLRHVAVRYGFSLDTPFRQLGPEVQRLLLHGDRAQGGRFEGVIPNLERRFVETESEWMKQEISRYMGAKACPACRGARLRPESLAVTIGGKSIVDVSRLTAREARALLTALPLSGQERLIAEPIVRELGLRLGFLVDVGLEYLTLDRESRTLSGGEAQRIRLATQVGAGLVGVLYILDEPSIGLHARDNARLLSTLERLRDLGNTVLVVEHDEATIRRADYVVDLGPGAGRLGGSVVAAGTVAEVLQHPTSLTARYLRGDLRIPIPPTRRPPVRGRWLEIVGAAEHNLQRITVGIPLGLFVCVTGVSGSGKSTLVHEVLYRALAQRLHGAKERPGRHTAVRGVDALAQVIVIDQSPIGRTPRSNAATYTGLFTLIRDVFAKLPEARLRGYPPGRFSFNVKGGRCEACQGDGIKRIEMHFLPDIYVPCEVCKGRRFNEATLEVRFRGQTIADLLAMPVEEAAAVFANLPAIREKLRTLLEVGLGYIELGQAATTLSGGEAQRVKLSRELSRRETGRTLYILDEPTTGLHLADIDKLLRVLHTLVDHGNSVLIIEHNLDVIKTADYVLDLGPEGGERGGRVVACGTPEEIAAEPRSYTGQCLGPLLGAQEPAGERRGRPGVARRVGGPAGPVGSALTA